MYLHLITIYNDRGTINNIFVIVTNSKNWNLSEWEEEPTENTYYKPTIINLSENGTTIKNNGTEAQTLDTHPNNIDDVFEPVS